MSSVQSPESSVPKPTILALHGFTGSGEDFRPLQETDAGADFDWICPDFMGHGECESPDGLEPYRLEATLDRIDMLRRFAPDPDRVILLAYSMGGRVALHYLMQANPLPAFLIGASPGLETEEERNARILQDQQWIDHLTGPNPIQEFCGKWEQQPLIEPQTRLPQPLRSQLAERRRRNNPIGLANSLRALGTGALPGLWAKIQDLPQIHLIHGENDTKFATIAGRMAALNPACQQIAIPGCGHAPHLENPEAIMSVLERQLDNPEG